MNKVVHCKKENFDVYIGRPSKWGNPFSYKSNSIAKYKVKNSNEALSKYRQWITEGEGKHLLKDLHELKDKTLGCWCNPKPCHGNILIELINQL